MHGSNLALRYSRILPVINVLLGALLIFFFVIIARDILSFSFSGGKESRQMSLAANVSTRRAGSIQEYEGIVRHNPFGIAAGQLRPIAMAGGEAASQSDIILIGTISGPDEYSYAIFSDKNGRQDVFKTGEQVFNGGRLKRVEKEKVFIEGGNGMTEIAIADIVAIKDAGPAQSNISAGTLSGLPGVSDFIRNTGSGIYLVDQKKILHLLENPGQLMTDVRLQPNFVNGRQEGYVLREVRSGGIYQSLGLQNNDVLLRINEYNISNPDVALQAFTALRGMDRIQMDIIRNGSKMTMTYLMR